jgi:hypothetical protein
MSLNNLGAIYYPRIAQRDVSYRKEMVGSDRIERDEKERMTSP